MLSFGVLIAFWSPKQYEIEESYLESMAKLWKAQKHEELKLWSPLHKQIRNARRGSKEKSAMKQFLITVMSATFGALPEIHFLHAIYHFKAREVKNLMLQTVLNSELKWRSYSCWKPNTTSWKPTSQHCEITLLLRSDFAALFVCLRNPADLIFTCEMFLSASRYLRPTLWDIFLQIFVV